MASGLIGREGLMSKLENMGIKTTTYDHPEAFTVEEMMVHVGHRPGAKCKNLFLYGKKKRDLWLLSARHDADVKLADVARQVKAPGGLRFAAEDILWDKLGVKQGCVTPFALINDVRRDVKFIVDEELLGGAHDLLYFHPMENNATTAIAPGDLQQFLKATGHEAISVHFDAAPAQSDQAEAEAAANNA